ncbi:MAG: hypothetical protein ACH350_00955 [Parachlamydiaceae bacterium]
MFKFSQFLNLRLEFLHHFISLLILPFFSFLSPIFSSQVNQARGLCFSLFLIFFSLIFSPLSGYVTIPRTEADTTSRMNAGGDPANRPGLRDNQRSPEYMDDWWGRNDYYYSLFGIRQTKSVTNPYYNSYYPLPNTYYPPDSNTYDHNARLYRPGNPR